MDLAESNITVLTGAGISAESGIPTFRGAEGYWTIGSNNYRPQEIATRAMFSRHPREVWEWYLQRIRRYRDVRPNTGHQALAEIERLLQDRFMLITQNVDNLHLKAGNSPKRTFQIHGNIFFMRCLDECRGRIYPLPQELLAGEMDQRLTQAEHGLLCCPDCGVQTRPHALWFDEYYDEQYYRYESSLKVASNTDVLIIAGTSGATNLPNLIAETACRNRAIIIDINLEENPFSKMALNTSHGRFLQTTCSEGLQALLGSVRKSRI